nr:6155_t:CDS:2 [Entrophospora candida]
MGFKIEPGMLIKVLFENNNAFFYKYAKIYFLQPINVGDVASVNERLGFLNFFLATAYDNVDIDTNEYSRNYPENMKLPLGYDPWSEGFSGDSFVKTLDYIDLYYLSRYTVSNVLSTSSNINNNVAKITTLPNGVRVTTQNIPGHFSAVGVYVDTGSRYETEKNIGSTENRSEEKMIETMESLGSNIMCGSNREAITYQSAIFPQDLSKVISLFADVIRNPLISQNEVIEQQQSILYEINEVNQKPDISLGEILHIVGYKNNTLGNPILCPEERLYQITPNLIKEFMSTWYVPERIVVAAIGADHDEVVDLVYKNFGGLGGVVEQSSDKTHVQLAFEGLSVHDPDIYALAILQSLLGGGGSFSAGGPDSGLFGIVASCDSEYSSILLEVLGQQFDTLTTFDGYNSITNAELFRAKNQLKSNLLMSLESRMVQLEDLGRQVQVFGKKIPIEEMCQKIDNLTLSDVIRVARRIIRGQVYNEGNGSGEVTLVFHDKKQLFDLPEVLKLCEKYGLGRYYGSNSKKN